MVSAASLHFFEHANLPKDVLTATRMERLSASRHLHLTIGLPTRDQANMQALVEAMYEKGNPQYHHYLTPDQFTSSFGPSEADYQKLTEFFKGKGLTIEGTSPGRVTLNVTGRVDQIERTFHVHLHNYRRGDGSQFFAPDVEPSVETEVNIARVGGLDNAHPAIPLVHNTGGGALSDLAPNGTGTSGAEWGNDIRTAYIPGVALTGAGQTIAIVSQEAYLPSDVSTYCTDTGIALASTQNVTCGSYSNLQNDTQEMTLDMEMANTMAPGAFITAYIGDDFDAILSQIASDGTAYQVTSSYGFTADTVTISLLTQLALQGQSYLNAAGDGGSYVNGAQDTNNSTVKAASLTGTVMDQSLVTVVGGTAMTLTGTGTAYGGEVVWNDTTAVETTHMTTGSGGGRSADTSIPSYQSVVSMATNNGSTTKRNIPDVACLAYGIQIVWNGAITPFIEGTSAAAPLWAGFIALVNEQAVNASKPPVGFLNPSLYAIGESGNYSSDFHDITVGNNDMTGSAPTQYSAVAGYDLATGWGTMKGQALINDLITNYVAPTATITPSPTNTPGGCGSNPGSSWTQLHNVIVSGQGGGAFDIHDGNGPEPVVIGGLDAGVSVLYAYPGGGASLGATQITVAPVTMRTNYDVVNFNGWTWVVGGLSGSTYMNDVWRTWDGVDYAKVTGSAAFAGRDNFGLVVYNNKLWVIGGQTATGTVVNDVWSSPDGITWTRATSSAAFSARQLLSAVVFNGQMWVMGGKNSGGTMLNDVYNSTDGVNWTAVSGSAFTAREAALVTVCGNDLWLIGGSSNGTSGLTDVWVSEDGGNWTKETNAAGFGASVTEYAACAFSYSGNVWVMGSNGTYTSSCCALPTYTPTQTSTRTSTSTQTATNTATKTASQTSTGTATNTATNSTTATATSTGTNTGTNTSTQTSTSTATNTETVTETQTNTSTNSSTNTPTYTGTNTATSTVTNTQTVTESQTNTATNSSTNTATNTPTLTNTQTVTESATATSTSSSTDTSTNTPTVTESATNTNTQTVTESATDTSTNTATDTVTDTQTVTQSATDTSTQTVTNTQTVTQSATDTSTSTATSTVTNTQTVTQSATNTSSQTVTLTETSTGTPTATSTSTATQTNSGTATSTFTSTNTSLSTSTSTRTATASSTATSSSTALATATGTFTSSPTVTATVGSVAIVYPDPVTGPGPVQLRLPLRSRGNVTVEIFTLAFRCVRTLNWKQVPVGQDVTLDLVDNKGSALANGLYYIRVTVPTGHSILKLLILR